MCSPVKDMPLATDIAGRFDLYIRLPVVLTHFSSGVNMRLKPGAIRYEQSGQEDGAFSFADLNVTVSFTGIPPQRYDNSS